MTPPENAAAPGATNSRGGTETDVQVPGGQDDDTAPDGDLAAERAAVGGSILSGAARAAVHRIMRNEDLTDPVCRVLDLAMRRMDATSVPVDQVTVAAFIEQHGLAHGPHLRHIRSLMLDIDRATPCPASAPWYASYVVQAATRREVSAAGRAIEKLAQFGPLDDLREAVAIQGRIAMAAIARAEQAVNG